MYFHPLLPEHWGFEGRVGDVDVRTLGHWQLDDNRTRLLIAAEIPCEKPALELDGTLWVPSEPRRLAEKRLEDTANLIAVFRRCKRSIASPQPPVAFVPESTEEQSLLSTSKGLNMKPVTTQWAESPLDFSQDLLDGMTDRTDGMSLLTEALANEHATGRFHELLRLFERAFGCSSTALVRPMASFLQVPRTLNYTESEIRDWVVELRHPATHADRRDTFLVEADLRDRMRRVEQAAYLVLFNKKNWREPDANRRQLLKLSVGITSETGGLTIVRGTSGRLFFQILDAFSAYPLDLSAGINCLPQGWWYQDSSKTQ